MPHSQGMTTQKKVLQLCWSRNLGSKFTPELQLKGQVTQHCQWDPGHPSHGAHCCWDCCTARD